MKAVIDRFENAMAALLVGEDQKNECAPQPPATWRKGRAVIESRNGQW